MITDNIPYYLCYDTTFGSLKNIYNKYNIHTLKYAFIHGENTKNELLDIAEYNKLGGNMILSFDTNNLESIDLFNYYKRILEITNSHTIEFIFETNCKEVVYKYHVQILQDLKVIFPILQIILSVVEYDYNMIRYYQKEINIPFVNIVFNQQEPNFTDIISKITNCNIDLDKLGIVFRYTDNIQQLSKWVLQQSIPLACISYFGLQNDKNLSTYNILNDVSYIQKNKICDTLVSKVLLENTFSQYHLPEWLVIDNVALGDEYEFQAETLSTKSIDNLLEELKNSNKCTIVNFDNHNSCFVKCGIGMSAKKKNTFSCFILKSQIPNKSILNTLI